MKRIVGIALVIGLVMAMAPFASAQGPAVTGTPGESHALSLQLYGSLDVQMRYGDSGFMIGQGKDDDTAVAGNNIDNPVWLGSPKLLLGLKAQLADKASAVVELMVPRIDGNELVNCFGMESGAGGTVIGVRQAYLRLDEALVQELSVTFGLQQVVFDVVGNNNPLLIALGRSESATAEWSDGPDQVAMAAGTWSYNGWNAREELPVGGLRLDYKLGDVGTISVFHMISVFNTLDQSEMVTGVDATYKITPKTTVEGLIALINGAGHAFADLPGGQFSGNSSEIWLIGIGAASNGEFVDGLNLFAQVGFNAGTYGTYNNGVDTEEVDATGIMFDIGASYQMVDMAFKPKFGIEYLYVSGNEKPSAGSPEDEYEGFVSYEDNNDLIILEDKEFGFDVDQNYSVIKFRASITTDVAGPVKDNFTLEMVLGIASLVEEMGPVGNEEDGLGAELDIKATWNASKNLTVYGGFGALFGSSVMEKLISPAVTGDANEDGDSAFTFFLGTNVTF